MTEISEHFDPELQAFLAEQRKQGFPAYQTVDVAKARAASQAVTLWRASMARFDDAVATIEHADVASVSGRLAARIYRPVSTPVGVITYFHGGGFVIGDLDTAEAHCRALCARAGCIVVSVDYRLAPEEPFPAAVHDAYESARWVSERLADGLPHVVAGDSAGGNLALTASVLARDTGFPTLAGQVLIYPMLDPAMASPSITTFSEGYLLDVSTLEWFWRAYLTGRPGSPLPQLARPLDFDLVGLPRTIVVTAEYDPLRDEGQTLARLLGESRVDVTPLALPGLLHGFFGWAPFLTAADHAVSRICTALKGLLLSAA